MNEIERLLCEVALALIVLAISLKILVAIIIRTKFSELLPSMITFLVIGILHNCYESGGPRCKRILKRLSTIIKIFGLFLWILVLTVSCMNSFGKIEEIGGKKIANNGETPRIIAPKYLETLKKAPNIVFNEDRHFHWTIKNFGQVFPSKYWTAKDHLKTYKIVGKSTWILYVWNRDHFYGSTREEEVDLMLVLQTEDSFYSPQEELRTFELKIENGGVVTFQGSISPFDMYSNPVQAQHEWLWGASMSKERIRKSFDEEGSLHFTTSFIVNGNATHDFVQRIRDDWKLRLSSGQIATIISVILTILIIGFIKKFFKWELPRSFLGIDLSFGLMYTSMYMIFHIGIKMASSYYGIEIPEYYGEIVKTARATPTQRTIELPVLSTFIYEDRNISLTIKNFEDISKENSFVINSKWNLKVKEHDDKVQLEFFLITDDPFYFDFEQLRTFEVKMWKNDAVTYQEPLSISQQTLSASMNKECIKNSLDEEGSLTISFLFHGNANRESRLNNDENGNELTVLDKEIIKPIKKMKWSNYSIRGGKSTFDHTKSVDPAN